MDMCAKEYDLYRRDIGVSGYVQCVDGFCYGSGSVFSVLLAKVDILPMGRMVG